MPHSDPSAPRPPTTACVRCGNATAHPFAGAGGVCLRCAGERAFALGSDTPFESLTPSEEKTSASTLAPDAAGSTAELPAAIGPYEIIEELGRGGMGRVYAARQRGLGRIVALKVLATGPGAPVELEMRFLREAQTVARLRHPHIIAIHDSGRATGHVYFSMDYLEGRDLARRLREHTFSPREAAALVAKVASALAFAHAEGVLHRDLKPSNILLDGDEPRLADFGLAAQLETSGDLTSASGVFGTPHYLAPEAICGGATALSAASDLYALGVVLYAVLTSRTPFAGASPAELPALVNETDPPAPRLLAPHVPRDLETICLKCLERDPVRRYADAAALAADLRHFLAGEPIAARPPDRLERFRRYARRHRTALLSAAGLFSVLAVATAVSSSLALRATRAEKLAATEAAAARAVSEFLQNDLLAQASPESQPDRDLTLRTVLERAAKAIDGRFPSQPLVEAELRETLAQTYRALGDHVAEAVHVVRALSLLKPVVGESDPRVLRLSAQHARVLAALSKHPEATALGRRTLALADRALGTDSPQTIRILLDLATIHQLTGDLASATAVASRALATARRVLPADHADTRKALSFLASINFSTRQLAVAEALDLEALAAQRRTDGSEHPATLTVMHDLASVYWAQGRLAEAQSLGLLTLEVRRRVLGPDHIETLRTQNNLATTYTDQGDYPAAIDLHEKTLAARTARLGPENADTLSTTMNLAMVHLRSGRLDSAEALLVPALTLAQSQFSANHALVHTAQYNLAELRLRQNRLPEAVASINESIANRVHALGPTNSQTLLAQESLATILIRQEKFAEATTILRTTLAQRTKTEPDAWRTHVARYKLGLALFRQDQLAEAEQLLVGSATALHAKRATLTAVARTFATDAATATADLYTKLGRTEEARRWSAFAAEKP